MAMCIQQEQAATYVSQHVISSHDFNLILILQHIEFNAQLKVCFLLKFDICCNLTNVHLDMMTHTVMTQSMHAHDRTVS